MVFAASSWHWLDPDVRYQRVGHALQPGGVLAIVGAHHAFPEGFDPFFRAIHDFCAQLGERGRPWSPPAPDQVADSREHIEASGLFTVIGIRRCVWAVEFSVDAYIDELNTHSRHIAWPGWKRDKVYAEARRLIATRPDKLIRRHYLSILHRCRRST